MSKGLYVAGFKISTACLKLANGQGSEIEQIEFDELFHRLMQTDQAYAAVTSRAGYEFWRFIKRHNHPPNTLEMEHILANGLNRVARQLFEWRTGIDGLTGNVLARGKQPRLREVILPIYRDACCRERAIRERFFPYEYIHITYFQPSRNHTEQEFNI